MKKKILSFLLAVCLVITLVPMVAFADENTQGGKVTINTVDELMKFAAAVNAGEYDEKTIVVSLEADLDMTGVDWDPICNVFDDEGKLLHFFKGEFNGNGHTISNLDLSNKYNRNDGVVGLFGVVDGVDISGLTVKGSVNVLPSDDYIYVYLGAIAGDVENSVITDCVSELTFNNNGIYINGCVGLAGYAENVKFENCLSKGNFNISGSVGSLYVGGIAGYLGGTSDISYCVNTADMAINAAHGGGLVGHLSGYSKMTNCYSIGKLTPLGKGIEDIGGLVGSLGSNVKTGTDNTISNCYFGGEIDLSQYTAKTPYGRFGGLVGKKDTSEYSTIAFENNFYTDTENVAACGNDSEAGTAKTIEYMKTKEFLSEIIAGGGRYSFNPSGTPVITADYSKVEAAIAKANALNRNDYKDFSGVDAAVKAVVYGKSINHQTEVDAMAKAIESAIAALEKKQASVETLKKINGKWYYIKDGKQDLTVTKLVKYGTKWYYVKNGVVDFTATTLVKQNTKWYYVKNGVIDFSFTGLTKYNNTWFYVYKGVVNFNSETLVKYNTRWYYVKNGRVDYKYTGNVTYKGSVYYVKNGVMQKKVS